jgi:putative DNA primase/helicase
MISTVDRARGHWRDILLALGVEPGFLSGRHGPCPVCGGKDRFRFTDKDGDGWFFCNQCGRGPGIVLLRRLHGWGHAEACRQVDEVLGAGAYQQPRSPAKTSRSDATKHMAIERVLKFANRPEIVARYLAERGIAVSSPVLRGHPACDYYDDHRRLVGSFPAVVVPILAPDGKLVCAHRIYLADLEPRKKNTEVIGTLKGAAVRLCEVEDEMGIGEGVETCLAAHQLFGIPTWAALTAYGVETFEPPPGVERLHIFGDNDTNYTGQRAAYVLAQRLARKIEVLINIPTEPDTDWNDVLNRRVGT